MKWGVMGVVPFVESRFDPQRRGACQSAEVAAAQKAFSPRLVDLPQRGGAKTRAAKIRFMRPLAQKKCVGASRGLRAAPSPCCAGSRAKNAGLLRLLSKGREQAFRQPRRPILHRRTLSSRAPSTGAWWAAQGELAVGM